MRREQQVSPIKPPTCRSCLLVFLFLLAVTFFPSRSPDIVYSWILTFLEHYFCAPFPPGTSAPSFSFLKVPFFPNTMPWF